MKTNCNNCDEIAGYKTTILQTESALINRESEIDHWKQRAEAAEARIQEAEKQEPVAWTDGQLYSTCKLNNNCIPLYTRPIPSPDVAELKKSFSEIQHNQATLIRDYADQVKALQESLRKEKIVSDNLGKIADSQAEKIVQLESQLEAAQSQVKVLREAMDEQSAHPRPKNASPD